MWFKVFHKRWTEMCDLAFKSSVHIDTIDFSSKRVFKFNKILWTCLSGWGELNDEMALVWLTFKPLQCLWDPVSKDVPPLFESGLWRKWRPEANDFIIFSLQPHLLKTIRVYWSKRPVSHHRFFSEPITINNTHTKLFIIYGKWCFCKPLFLLIPLWNSILPKICDTFFNYVPSILNILYIWLLLIYF